MPVITTLGRHGDRKTANLRLRYICGGALAQHIRVAIFYRKTFCGELIKITIIFMMGQVCLVLLVSLG